MIAVRRKVLDELLTDARWEAKLSRARTKKQAAEVVAAFCRARGYEVRRLDGEGVSGR